MVPFVLYGSVLVATITEPETYLQLQMRSICRSERAASTLVWGQHWGHIPSIAGNDISLNKLLHYDFSSWMDNQIEPIFILSRRRADWVRLCSLLIYKVSPSGHTRQRITVPG